MLFGKLMQLKNTIYYKRTQYCIYYNKKKHEIALRTTYAPIHRI